jgi:hypothetical protein
MTSKKWTNGAWGRFAGVVLVVAITLATYLALFPKGRTSITDPAEAPMVDDALSRQAEHERDSATNVRSRNIVQVRRLEGGRCVELRNLQIATSSSYCYRLKGGRWELSSERAGTQ